ncbi:MAG: RHS repeat-associated core domain-containing protein [Acetobacteraceae bacterium]
MPTTATTICVTDADKREVLEYESTSGQVQRCHAHGLRPNDVLNRMNVEADTHETMIPDLQGSIIATLDSASGTLTRTGHMPFGESASAAGTFRYTGLRIDPETNGLYYARARICSPTWGRFLQPDPIGDARGSALYAYVGNDPLNRADPLGLCDNPQGCGGSSNQLITASASSVVPASTASAAAAAVPVVSQQGGTAVSVVGGNAPSVTLQPTGSSLSAPPAAGGSIELAARSPTLYRQNVECGTPTGGAFYPLCPDCHNRLMKNPELPPVLLENGQRYRPERKNRCRKNGYCHEWACRWNPGGSS